MIPIKRFGKYRRYFLILIDIVIIIVAYFFGEAFICDTVRFTLSELTRIALNIILALVVYEVILICFRLYNNITRFEVGKDYLLYFLSSIFSGLLVCIINNMFHLHLLTFKHNMSISALIGIALISYRLAIKILLNYDTEQVWKQKAQEAKDENKRNLLIIGGGDATRTIIDSIKHSMKKQYNIVGIIDDSEGKIGYRIRGIKILGNRNDIIETVIYSFL